MRDMLSREPMLEFVPILSISAKEGLRVHRVIQEIKTVYANCRRVLGRERIAEAFAEMIAKNPAPSHQGRAVRVTRACQIMVEPPVMNIETNRPELVEEPYRRYLLKSFFEVFPDVRGSARLNFDTKLTLRKDEDLEQFTESTDSLPAGPSRPRSGWERSSTVKLRHPRLRLEERRAHERVPRAGLEPALPVVAVDLARDFSRSPSRN